MAARFKCKKCRERFDFSDGREAITFKIEQCPKNMCPLRNRQLAYIPLKRVTEINDAANEPNEESVEVFEEEPISGLISQKDIRKLYGHK